MANNRILVAMFFDQPNLLGVHLVNPAAETGTGFVPAGVGRIASFAGKRTPDGRGGCAVAAGAVALVCLVGVIARCDMTHGHQSQGSTTTTLQPQPSAPVAAPHPQPVVARTLVIDGPQGALSNGESWSRVSSLDLADDLQPHRAELVPFQVRTLLDLPRDLNRSGTEFWNWLQPRCTAEDRQAFREGRVLSRSLAGAGAGSDLAVILDLPGPQAVAAAAGMAEHFDPVFTVDNLPHPSGVVPVEQTLAAAVFWQPTLMGSPSARNTDGTAGSAPVVFILDGQRLAPYQNQVDRFDNRSCAKLPDAAGFGRLGIRRILYVRPHQGAVAEADDLNQLFVTCIAKDIEVRHLGLDQFAGIEAESDEPADHPLDPATVAPTSAASSTWPPGVHGALIYPNWWWANHYGWYRPLVGRSPVPVVVDPDGTYQATPRGAAWGMHWPSLGNWQRNQVMTTLTTPRPNPAPPAPLVATGHPPPVAATNNGWSNNSGSTGSFNNQSSHSFWDSGSWGRSSGGFGGGFSS